MLSPVAVVAVVSCALAAVAGLRRYGCALLAALARGAARCLRRVSEVAAVLGSTPAATSASARAPATMQQSFGAVTCSADSGTDDEREDIEAGASGVRAAAAARARRSRPRLSAVPARPVDSPASVVGTIFGFGAAAAAARMLSERPEDEQPLDEWLASRARAQAAEEEADRQQRRNVAAKIQNVGGGGGGSLYRSSTSIQETPRCGRATSLPLALREGGLQISDTLYERLRASLSASSMDATRKASQAAVAASLEAAAVSTAVVSQQLPVTSHTMVPKPLTPSLRSPLAITVDGLAHVSPLSRGAGQLHGDDRELTAASKLTCVPSVPNMDAAAAPLMAREAVALAPALIAPPVLPVPSLIIGSGALAHASAVSLDYSWGGQRSSAHDEALCEPAAAARQQRESRSNEEPGRPGGGLVINVSRPNFGVDMGSTPVPMPLPPHRLLPQRLPTPPLYPTLASQPDTAYVLAGAPHARLAFDGGWGVSESVADADMQRARNDRASARAMDAAIAHQSSGEQQRPALEQQALSGASAGGVESLTAHAFFAPKVQHLLPSYDDFPLRRVGNSGAPPGRGEVHGTLIYSQQPATSSIAGASTAEDSTVASAFFETEGIGRRRQQLQRPSRRTSPHTVARGGLMEDDGFRVAHLGTEEEAIDTATVSAAFFSAEGGARINLAQRSSGAVGIGFAAAAPAEAATASSFFSPIDRKPAKNVSTAGIRNEWQRSGNTDDDKMETAATATSSSNFNERDNFARKSHDASTASGSSNVQHRQRGDSPAHQSALVPEKQAAAWLFVPEAAVPTAPTFRPLALPDDAPVTMTALLATETHNAIPGLPASQLLLAKCSDDTAAEERAAAFAARALWTGDNVPTSKWPTSATPKLPLPQASMTAAAAAASAEPPTSQTSGAQSDDVMLADNPTVQAAVLSGVLTEQRPVTSSYSPPPAVAVRAAAAAARIYASSLAAGDAIWGGLPVRVATLVWASSPGGSMAMLLAAAAGCLRREIACLVSLRHPRVQQFLGAVGLPGCNEVTDSGSCGIPASLRLVFEAPHAGMLDSFLFSQELPQMPPTDVLDTKLTACMPQSEAPPPSLGWAIIRSLALDIARGMAYLHARKQPRYGCGRSGHTAPFMHGALHPGACTLDGGVRAKVGDVRHVAFLAAAEEAARRLAPRLTAGQPPAVALAAARSQPLTYAPPELLRAMTASGASDTTAAAEFAAVSPAADIYAFGCIIWALVERRPPSELRQSEVCGGHASDAADVDVYDATTVNALLGRLPAADAFAAAPAAAASFAARVIAGARPPLPNAAEGSRLARAEHVPASDDVGRDARARTALLDLLAACWAESPNDRPTFPAIVARLERLPA